MDWIFLFYDNLVILRVRGLKMTTNSITGKVNSILDGIKQNTSEEAPQPVKEKKAKSEMIAKSNKIDVRGKPKSGRFWKSKKERFSTINKTKGLKQDFEKKTALRLELKRTKELSKQLIEQLKEKELDRKKRRQENLKRAEENRKKSEIVQVITNTAKLKRMKKKQLRFIEKRDTNKSVDNKM